MTADAVRVRRRRPGRHRTVLLHGLGGGISSWDGFAAHVDADLELWDAQLPWHSAGSGRWSRRDDAAAAVAQALAAVPGDPDVVIAHSFAANLMLELLATKEIQQPRAVVLVSPFYRPTPEDFTWETAESYLHGLLAILDEGLRVSSGGRLDDDVRENMAHRLRERIGPYGWVRFFDAYLRSPMVAMDAVRPPVLVVSGRDDRAARAGDA
ncbi:alpha/beta fold hydrolase, partial [Amycolatopsis sp. NPDC000740]